MKGLKNEILTRQESRHSSRLDVFYFLPTAHFLLASKTLQENALLPTPKIITVNNFLTIKF
jgi:hypothetical protein